MKTSLQPQEIEVFYILPALRRELTIAMKELGFSQKKIAKLLGVTEPAVSQYLSKKRAMNVEFSDRLKLKVMDSAKKITDHFSLVEQMQYLMRATHEEKTKCGVCHELTGKTPACMICYDGGKNNGSKTAKI